MPEKLAGARRPHHSLAQKRPRRSAHRKRKRPSWRMRLAAAAAVLILLLLAWAVLARRFAPTSNTSLTRFSAIIVLGEPADPDGNPSPAELASVTEGVREYERGVAPRLIFSGGAAHNRFVEAEVMARAAEAQGISASDILVEGGSMDTIQNACYSTRIMEAHGWRSAEVISSAAHLPRAALIFSRFPLEWRVHAAPQLEPASALDTGWNAALETLKTARYLAWARAFERCQP